MTATRVQSGVFYISENDSKHSFESGNICHLTSVELSLIIPIAVWRVVCGSSGESVVLQEVVIIFN